MMVEDALEELDQSEMSVLRLAEVASLAVEIEPALLRRLRRSLVPEASPLAESLLWSSPLASSYTPTSLLIRDDALRLLRERLRQDQDRLDAARAVVEASHQGSPEILRCEEELVYLGLVDLEKKPRAGIDRATIEEQVRKRLEQVMRSIQEDSDRRESLLAWSYRALPSLPARVQTHEAYAVLAVLTSVGTAAIGEKWTTLLPPSERDVTIGVRWTSTGLMLSAQQSDEPVLRLPPLRPLLVEVEALTGDDWAKLGRVVVPPQDSVVLEIGSEVTALRLISLRGDGLRLRRHPSEAERAGEPLAFSNVWVLVAGTAQYELSPTEVQAAEELGTALAENGCGLITGAFQGVDHVVSQAFLKRLVSLDASANTGAGQERLMRVVHHGRSPDFSQGILRRVDSLSDEYWVPVERATAVVVIGTTVGTREVALTAVRAGRPVFAYPGTGAELLPGTVEAPEEEPAWGTPVATRIVQHILVRSASPSPMAHWAGEKLMALAVRYLRPQPLDESDVVASRLLKAIERRRAESRGDVPESAFLSNSPPERVLRYLATRLSPEAQLLPLLLHALSIEVVFAKSFYEPRPLWQGLGALQHLLALPEVQREFPRSDIIERLRVMLESLKIWPKLDLGGECKALLRKMLSEVGRNTLEDLARKYEDLRRTHSGGPRRTAAMDKVVTAVRHEASRLGIQASQIVRMYRENRAGLRVVALACCIERPDEAPVEIVADVLGSPQTPFEQWVALLATQSIVRSVEIERAETCAAATLAALDDRSNRINERGDSSRRSLAADILESFVGRVGFAKVEPSEALRLWLLGNRWHLGSPRPGVAVFGSSSSTAYVPLCQFLGGRLAAYGWRLGIGRGDNIGPVVLEGFRRRDGVDVTLYTTSQSLEEGLADKTKVFRSREDARRQMVADADCCIVLCGGRGTLEECELAMNAGLPILAVTFTGGTAGQVTESTRHALKALRVPDAALSLMDTAGQFDESAERIVRVLNIILSRLAEQRTSRGGDNQAKRSEVTNVGMKANRPTKKATTPEPAQNVGAAKVTKKAAAQKVPTQRKTGKTPASVTARKALRKKMEKKK